MSSKDEKKSEFSYGWLISLLNIGDEDFCENSQGHYVFSQKSAILTGFLIYLRGLQYCGYH